MHLGTHTRAGILLPPGRAGLDLIYVRFRLIASRGGKIYFLLRIQQQRHMRGTSAFCGSAIFKGAKIIELWETVIGLHIVN